MAVLSHFTLNSDYTSIKEVQDFDVTLSSAAKSTGSYAGFTRTLNIPVPDGTYLENMTMTFSLTGEVSPTPFYTYIKSAGDGFYQIFATIRKATGSNYQIYCMCQNMTSSTRSIPAFTVRVRGHLFVSTQ